MTHAALSEKEVMRGWAGSVRQKCRWLRDDEGGGGGLDLSSQGLRDGPWEAKFGRETGLSLSAQSSAMLIGWPHLPSSLEFLSPSIQF